MSTQQLVDELLNLPLRDRIDVAQAVWQSINEASDLQASEAEPDVLAQARRRDAELTAGVVPDRTHDAVMASVRRALGCE